MQLKTINKEESFFHLHQPTRNVDIDQNFD